MICKKFKRSYSIRYYTDLHLKVMSEDMDRIFEISLNKIEHCKSHKVHGNANMLHRTLLVNTVINRVKSCDNPIQHKNESLSSFMDYREPKGIFEIEDYDMDKNLPCNEFESRSWRKIMTTNVQQKKEVSSLVDFLDSRSICGRKDEPFTKKFFSASLYRSKENSLLNVGYVSRSRQDSSRRIINEKRHFSTLDCEDQPRPKKRLRCIWPNNVSPSIQDMSYSISGLASLFSGLVANSDTTDKTNITHALNTNFPTAMVAF